MKEVEKMSYYKKIYCAECGQQVCQGCGCCCNPICEYCSCPTVEKDTTDYSWEAQGLDPSWGVPQ